MSNDEGVPEGIEIVKIFGKVRAIIGRAALAPKPAAKPAPKKFNPFDVTIPETKPAAPPAKKSPFDVTIPEKGNKDAD